MLNINLLKFKRSHLLLACLSIFLCTCSSGNFRNIDNDLHRDPIDPEVNLTRDDVRDALRPSAVSKHKNAENQPITSDEAPIPDFNPVLAAPESPDVKTSKKVSLSVNENIDIRDVLTELARLA